MVWLLPIYIGKIQKGKMKERNNIFNDRLKQLIKESGISTNQVEKDLGYSRNTLHNYRNGQEPSANRLIELSNYFGVSPEYLIGAPKGSKVVPLDTFFKRLSFKQKKALTSICQDWVLSTLSPKEL